ncbi:MAG: hypothetical protein ACLFQV_08425 [Vulcanimicrobiota bacterium]
MIKKIFWVIFLISILFITQGVANENFGPTLSGVTEDVLNIEPDTGKWQPRSGWYVFKPDPSSDLTVNIINNKQVIASAKFDFDQKLKTEQGDWYNTLELSKIKNLKDSSDVLFLQPGDYKVEVASGKKNWTSPFQVKKNETDDKDQFYITGFWKELAYIYMGNRDEGFNLNFWYRGFLPDKNYKTHEIETSFLIKGQILKDDNILLETDELPMDIPVNKVLFKKVVIGNENEALANVLVNDGEYRALVLISRFKKKWNKIVDISFKVEKGMIIQNPDFTGAEYETPAPVISDSACYQKNKAAGLQLNLVR